MIQILKKYSLPIAMLTGVALHPWLAQLIFVTPFTIFTMLLLTFCRMSLSDFRLKSLHFVLLAIQIVGSVIMYLILQPFSPLIAQAVMICILAPPATASAVVTGMLGGDIAFTASFIFLGNMGTALATPVIFAAIGSHSDLPFMISVLTICKHVFPMLVLPLLLALFLQRSMPKTHDWLASKTMFSFYLWGMTLAIVTGNTANFILHQENPEYLNEILLALSSMLICGVLFFSGKALGSLFHDRISGGQALGQKNTVFAIWIALTYSTHPLSALAPAFYVIWQNSFNAWQLWRRQRSK